MKKFILILLPLVIAAAPIHALAQAEHEGIEASISSISITVNGSNVHIVGANGEVMEIFNLTGVKVSTTKIDSADKTYTLNLPKGCYILKVGKIVRKFSIR